MWSFLFTHGTKIRPTGKAEAERERFREDSHFFTAVLESGKAERFQKLDGLVHKTEFMKKVKVMRSFSLKKRRPEEKWSGSYEQKVLAEFRELRKDPELRRYRKLASDAVFNRYYQWQQTFEDTFTQLYPDPRKWISRYYAGERFLKDSYAVGEDVQLFQPGNVEVNEKGLQLTFRSEQKGGKYWDSRYGIMPRKFAYTSGMVNTAFAFRQHLGRFEAKINISGGEADQCFFLACDVLYPHINILQYNRDGFHAGCFVRPGMSDDNTATQRNQVRLKPGAYIFTLEWTEEKLFWMINDTIVRTSDNNLPGEALFLGFSLCARHNVAETNLPQKMLVEWVRVYSKKQ